MARLGTPAGARMLSACQRAYDNETPPDDDEEEEEEVDECEDSMSAIPKEVRDWQALEQRAEKAEAEVRGLREAIGLMTTALPAMEMRVDDPVGMAQEVVAALAQAREENEELRALCAARPRLNSDSSAGAFGAWLDKIDAVERGET